MKNIKKTIKALVNHRKINALEKEYRTTNRVLNAEYKNLGNLHYRYRYALAAGGYYARDIDLIYDDITRTNDRINALKDSIKDINARLKTLRG